MFFPQATHLARHNGETAPRFSGACSLDGRVESQQVGLIRNVLDEGDDSGDTLSHISQRPHIFSQIARLDAHASHGLHGSAHYFRAGTRLTLSAFSLAGGLQNLRAHPFHALNHDTHVGRRPDGSFILFLGQP